jgi:hypothetical protein
MSRRLYALLSVTGLLISGAGAQDEGARMPLPQLATCESDTHPRLPERWRATYLMAPFVNGQLVLGEIVYDAALPAMRVRLFGVKGGSADLLVTATTTYALGDAPASESCRDLGNTGWRPLPRDWLKPQSRCLGSAPVGETPVAWWRTAITPAPASYWVWYKASDQSPFRLVFPFASDRLPPLSRYAFSYQVGFEPLPQTDLSDLAATCKAAPRARVPQGRRALARLLDGMTRSTDRAAGEIKRLMPALAPSCVAGAFPSWPEQLAMTGLMTPFDADEEPYPTEILYDWTLPGQRTRIFGQPRSPIAAQDSLLLDARGFTVTHHSGRGLSCEAVLPGTIRPDWAARAPCECAAEITATTPLTPYGPTQIRVCPLASPRVAWAWYAQARPTVFMVTSRRGDEGKGLFAVLDYRDWLPGYPVLRSAFEKPAQCAPARRASRPAPPPPPHCSTCHLGKAASAP